MHVVTLLHWRLAVTAKTMSAREFNQDTAAAKRAAKKGPVYVTDRGRPTHVLLSVEQYERIARKPRRSIGDMLSNPAAAEIEFDPPRLGFIAREVDLG
jgi:PHD/YefM family antitoxin component YafN of YafNO toxin-antitoxin module